MEILNVDHARDKPSSGRSESKESSKPRHNEKQPRHGKKDQTKGRGRREILALIIVSFMVRGLVMAPTTVRISLL